MGAYASCVNGLVTGFNGFVGYVSAPIRANLPEKVVSATKYIAASTSADKFKTLWVKPVMLMGSLFEKNGSGVPVFCKIAATTKLYISGLEVISKLPSFLENISSKVADNQDPTRKYCIVFKKTVNGKDEIVYESKEERKIETAPEALAGRMFFVANWFIAVSDTVMLTKESFPNRLPKVVENLTPWIYTIAGGYMSVQGLYAERSFFKQISDNNTEIPVVAEKYYYWVNIATSISYLFLSITSAMGLYYKKDAPSWLKNCQLATSAATIVVPLVQRCAKDYMDATYWNPKPSKAATPPDGAVPPPKSTTDTALDAGSK
ncbi:MAG: hypothetical protein ABSA17_01875 [Rhabdochlamydiaceae bacterium]|jgi:hypothetical protein